MNEELLGRLKEQLSNLAFSVGFQFYAITDTKGEVKPPAGMLLWASPVALLAVIPFQSMDSEIFAAIFETSRNWMACQLTESEQRARFIDGYLVFALPETPSGVLLDSVRRVKLDTAICRKQVLWPSQKGDWTEALWTVTVLGLPTIGGGAENPAATLELTPIAEHALDLYRQEKNYQTVAEKLREETHEAAQKEDINAAR